MSWPRNNHKVHPKYSLDHRGYLTKTGGLPCGYLKVDLCRVPRDVAQVILECLNAECEDNPGKQTEEYQALRGEYSRVLDELLEYKRKLARMTETMREIMVKSQEAL